MMTRAPTSAATTGDRGDQEGEACGDERHVHADVFEEALSNREGAEGEDDGLQSAPAEPRSSRVREARWETQATASLSRSLC